MARARNEFDRLLEAREKKGREEGREQGMAQTVLHVLRARGITVTQALRQRIVSCSDVRQLTALAKRAAVATSADDLFAST